MELEQLSDKHLSDLEQSLRALLVVIKKVKLQNQPLTEALVSLEQDVGKVRRTRFDLTHPEYRSY